MIQRDAGDGTYLGYNDSDETPLPPPGFYLDPDFHEVND